MVLKFCSKLGFEFSCRTDFFFKALDEVSFITNLTPGGIKIIKKIKASNVEITVW